MDIALISTVFICLTFPLVKGNCPPLDSSLQKTWHDDTATVTFTDNGMTLSPFEITSTSLTDYTCIAEKDGFRIYKSSNEFYDFNDFITKPVYTCIRLIDDDPTDHYLQLASYGSTMYDEYDLRYSALLTDPEACEICRLQYPTDKPAVLSFSYGSVNPQDPKTPDCNLPETCSAVQAHDILCVANTGGAEPNTGVAEPNIGDEIENGGMADFCQRLMGIIEGDDSGEESSGENRRKWKGKWKPFRPCKGELAEEILDTCKDVNIAKRK